MHANKALEATKRRKKSTERKRGKGDAHQGENGGAGGSIRLGDARPDGDAPTALSARASRGEARKKRMREGKMARVLARFKRPSRGGNRWRIVGAGGRACGSDEPRERGGWREEGDDRWARPVGDRERERELASWASAQEEKKGAQDLGPAGQKEKGGGKSFAIFFFFQTKFSTHFPIEFLIKLTFCF